MELFIDLSETIAISKLLLKWQIVHLFNWCWHLILFLLVKFSFIVFEKHKSPTLVKQSEESQWNLHVRGSNEYFNWIWSENKAKSNWWLNYTKYLELCIIFFLIEYWIHFIQFSQFAWFHVQNYELNISWCKLIYRSLKLSPNQNGTQVKADTLHIAWNIWIEWDPHNISLMRWPLWMGRMNWSNFWFINWNY